MPRCFTAGLLAEYRSEFLLFLDSLLVKGLRYRG